MGVLGTVCEKGSTDEASPRSLHVLPPCVLLVCTLPDTNIVGLSHRMQNSHMPGALSPSQMRKRGKTLVKSLLKSGRAWVQSLCGRVRLGAAGMNQGLRTRAALTKNWGSVPSTHVVWLITTCNSSLRVCP